MPLIIDKDYAEQFEDPSIFDVATKDGGYPVHEAIIYGHEIVAKWWIEKFDQMNLV